MKAKHMRFGDYIKRKRLDHPKQLSQKDMAEHLGVALSYVSMVENRYKRPFDGERLEKLADFLDLTEDETATMYDLASRESREVPYDIEETLMYDDVGDLIRYAARQSKKGFIKEDDWKTWIRQMEDKRNQELGG